MRSHWRSIAYVGCVLAGCALWLDGASAQTPAPWAFFGGDVSNTRGHLSPNANVNLPTQINPRTTPRLALAWSYSTIGDVSATPTVEAGGLYVPDYAGYLYKLDPDSGALIWSHQLSDYLGGAYGFSRNSPAIGALGEIVLGNQVATGGATPGARVLSINRTTGGLMWQAIVDPSPHAFITTSPVIYNHRIYVGVTSSEESLSASVANFKPIFRGSVVALDEATGTVLWKFYTVPFGYTGGAVWGSNPVAWGAGGALFVGTGNNLSIPTSASQCEASGATPAARLACLDPTDFVDSLLSLDLVTGSLRWSRRTDADTWTFACLVGPASACPTPTGPDTDFGSAPNLVYLSNFVGVPDDRGGLSRSYFLGAGQKSGVYYGLNPSNGGLYWSTYVGQGQIMWGSAIELDDRNAVIVPLENRPHWTNVLAGRKGAPVTWNAGAWGSLSLFTGRFNWQIPTVGQDIAQPAYGGAATGPVSFTNRVAFAGSTSGIMVGIDSTSGNVLWTFNAGGSIIGGASIFNETLYFGAGAVRSGPGSVHTLFAFRVPAS